MELSKKIRKRLTVNVPITNDAPRVYAWIDELEQLEAENEAFKNHIRNSLFGMTTEQENEWLAEVVKEHTDALKEPNND